MSCGGGAAASPLVFDGTERADPEDDLERRLGVRLHQLGELGRRPADIGVLARSEAAAPHHLHGSVHASTLSSAVSGKTTCVLPAMESTAIAVAIGQGPDRVRELLPRDFQLVRRRRRIEEDDDLRAPSLRRVGIEDSGLEGVDGAAQEREQESRHRIEP
jgi:hypothetical protein